MWILSLQQLLIEALLDLIYFPLWWYTVGAWRALRYCFLLLSEGNDQFAPGLWLRNIFVPMYGQYDWEGRLISFFMRLIQVIVRLFALLIWLAVCVVLFGCWLALPVAVAYGLSRGIFVK